VAVFWTRAHDFADIFAEALEGDPQAVAALLGSPWKGRPAALDQEAPFYLLVLSGAQGRAILRGWFESTLRKVAENVSRYFLDIALIKRFPSEPDVLPLRQVLRSLAAFEDDKNLSPNLPPELFKAILFGNRYPHSVFEAALRRLRAEHNFSRARLAVVKAVLKRNQDMEVKKEMDESNTHVGYRLGRLFAVLDRLQAAAIGKPSATIVDRFYGAASTTPVLVFPRLLALAQHHARKAGKLGGYFQGLIEEIVRPLDPENAFPSALALEEQGLFALGYYHQRAAKPTKGNDHVERGATA
jgi:CRISPR-associated protein Csd1